MLTAVELLGVWCTLAVLVCVLWAAWRQGRRRG